MCLIKHFGFENQDEKLKENFASQTAYNLATKLLTMAYKEVCRILDKTWLDTIPLYACFLYYIASLQYSYVALIGGHEWRTLSANGQKIII